jgi:hypothetical protein
VSDYIVPDAYGVLCCAPAVGDSDVNVDVVEWLEWEGGPCHGP